MGDRHRNEDYRARRRRVDEERRDDPWWGGEARSFSERSERGSGHGHDHPPSRPDYYGAGRDVSDYEPRWDRSSSRYEGRRERWDDRRREARRDEAARWRDRYEASRFSSDEYEPTRAGFDPYVRDFGTRGDYRFGSRHGGEDRYRYGARHEPEYAYGREPGRDWWDHAKDRVAGVFGDDEARMRADRDSWRGYEAGRAGQAGRGPKGYARSDDRIREDVSDRLSDDAWLDASDIEVRVASCEVTLDGTVGSRADKRRAEDLVESVSGVRHVQNNLRVQASAQDRRAMSQEFDLPPSASRSAGSTSGKLT